MVRWAAFLLFSLVILGPGPPAIAQGTAPYSKADTLRAVRAYFAERRSSALAVAVVGGVTTGLGVAAGVAGASSRNLGAAVAVLEGVVLVAVGLPLLLAGNSRHKQLTPEREAAAVSGYEHGQALPLAIGRRLKRRHFAQ